uniref:ubiquitinyl hydrolase 1 n=1 Tax=Anas platyrhynchos TaxID=8839 RepID=A0A8B9TKF8_ANAPL
MNSILQVLSHLQKFRECFLTLDLCETEELLAKTVNGKSRMPGKLANGSAANESGKTDKWALVSPFAMLHSVWSLIPAFRGYDQQDAQEFLCELLDKVQQELESEGTNLSAGIHVPNFIFVPTFHPQVTCITCNYKSNTVEPFWDLSLEFPERYHSIEKGIIPVNQTECMLTEMLAKFTETEALEGRIYKPWIFFLRETFVYDLSAVVMHHGKGFGSGHYTAYCYNTEGGKNNSKLRCCPKIVIKTED